MAYKVSADPVRPPLSPWVSFCHEPVSQKQIEMALAKASMFARRNKRANCQVSDSVKEQSHFNRRVAEDGWHERENCNSGGFLMHTDIGIFDFVVSDLMFLALDGKVCEVAISIIRLHMNQ
jgi:hypothetical protein